MDIDAFVVRHQGTWLRLSQLTDAARKPRSLSADQLAEFVSLYQAVGAHLADARVTYASDHALTSRLTLLVSDAHNVLYSQRDIELKRSLYTFVTVTYPRAVWRIRWFVVAATLCMMVPWLVFNVWLAVSPRAVSTTGPEALRDQYIHGDFVDYYRSPSASAFANQVFWNNVRVAIFAFVLGIFGCIGTALILAYNGASVGIAAGLFTSVGEWEKFWGLILPHGLLELSAVVVAGAAGLRIGWTVIDPGDRPRIAALAEEGRHAGTVVMGLVIAFLLAAMIEGFVTGQPWPTAIRVGIGVIVFALFWGATISFAIDQRRRDSHAAARLDIDRRDARGRSSLTGAPQP